MKNSFKKIFIERTCLTNLLASALEVYPRETTGILIGRTAKRKIKNKLLRMAILQGAYPIQTAKRKFAEVDPLENKRAFLRAFKSIVVIPKLFVAGEYHSHPDDTAELSEDDLEYISDRFDDIYKKEDVLLERGKWLEILIRIRKKVYAQRKEPGWSFSDYAQKARCLLRVSPKKGFDFTIGAYWVYRKKGKMRKKEIEVYVPWTQSRYWV